jgi:hypothetical protein
VAGQYANTGTATATDVLNQPVSGSDLSHYFGYTPTGIQIEKSTNGVDADDAPGPLVAVGSPVTWTYVVTNRGNTPLSSVTVTDDQGLTIAGPIGDANNNGKLDPTETWTYTANGTTEVDQYRNLGTASAIDALGQIVSDSDLSHYFGYTPTGIRIEKSTNGEDADDAPGPLLAVGVPVAWTYVLTNPGNTPLANVTVTDDQGVTIAGPTGDANNDGKLDPSETWTYTASGTAVAGQYANTGTATATDVLNQPVSGSDLSHYFGYTPTGIQIEKSTNGVDADDAPGPLLAVGSPVTWTYVVTNRGNTSLSSVAVTDDQGLTIAGPIGDANHNGKLDPTETWRYTANGTTEVDQYRNLGTASAIDALGQIVSDSDLSHYFGYTQTGIRIEKSTNGEDADGAPGPLLAVGVPVAWTYVVANPGNTPLSNVTVIDDQGVTIAGPTGDANNDGKLDPSETWTYTASGTAVAGQYANTGTATATDVLNQPVSGSDRSHYFGYTPTGIQIEKSTNGVDADDVPGPLLAVGSPVTWTYVVTNRGNTPLSNVVVSDDRNVTIAGPIGDANNDGKLDPSETWTYTAHGQAMAGQYSNLGTVTATGVLGQLVRASDPSHYFGCSPPGIRIKTSTNGQDADIPPGPFLPVGSPVTWSYRVTNSGNTPLLNVQVVDNRDVAITGPDGDVNNDGRLDPTETWTYTAGGVAVAGQYDNLGTATALDAFDWPVGDSDPSHYFGGLPLVVLGPDKNPGTPQAVRVIDGNTGLVESSFVAYETGYAGGTRVAVADLDGDGTDEIITAPGRSRAPEVRIFTREGAAVAGFPGFLAYDAAFTGGVHVAVADVNGDGRPDIVTVPSYGAADVRVFFNRYPQSPAFQAAPDITFQAFPVVSIGGAVVAAADMGRLVDGKFANVPDGKAEIVVGTGGGVTASVSVFDVTGTVPTRVQTFFPFTAITASFKGGVSLDVARIDADLVPDVIVGMGANGASRIEVWAWNPLAAKIAPLGAIPAAFTVSSKTAPVQVAATDTDGNGIADAILAVQGPDGTTGEIHRFDIASTTPFLVQQAPPQTGFPGPWFIATNKWGTPGTAAPKPEPIIAPLAYVWTNPVNPYDVNNGGLVTPLDVLEIINYINANPGQTALPAQPFSPPRFLDTNIDGRITPEDVLVVLNYLNGAAAGAGEGESSGLGKEIAATFRPWDSAVSTDAFRRQSSTIDSRREQVLGERGTALVPGMEWFLPDAEDHSPGAPESSPPRWEESKRFDLEAVLEEIAAEVAAPWLGRDSAASG